MTPSLSLTVVGYITHETPGKASDAMERHGGQPGETGDGVERPLTAGKTVNAAVVV